MHAHVAFSITCHEPLKAICVGFGWMHDTESGVAWVSFVRLLQIKALAVSKMCTELGTPTILPKQLTLL